MGRRSRANRIARPPLHVFYWTGAPSAPCEVRNISLTGAFIVSEDHWHPGTVMHLILQVSDTTGEKHHGVEYFGAWAKVVRCAEAGLGVHFLWGDRRERAGFRRFMKQMKERMTRGQPALSELGTAPQDGDSPHCAAELLAAPGETATVAGGPDPRSVQAPPPESELPLSGGPKPDIGAEDVPRLRNARAGSTLVEFAFVLLPLLAILFGAIEMDRMLLSYNAISESARAGVRYAVVHGHYNPTSTTNIEQVARNFVAMGILDPARATVTVTYEDGTNHIGSPVSVYVTYPFDPLTSFFPLSVTLGSTAKGTITF